MKPKISRNIKDIESFMAELDELGNDMKAAVKEMPIEDIRNGCRPGVYAYITAASIVSGLKDYFKSPDLSLDDVILGCVLGVAEQFNDREETKH